MQDPVVDHRLEGRLGQQLLQLFVKSQVLWLLRGLGLIVPVEDVDLADRLHKHVQVVQVPLHLFPLLAWRSLRLLFE